MNTHNLCSYDLRQAAKMNTTRRHMRLKMLLPYIPINAIVCLLDTQQSNYVKLLQARGNNVIYTHKKDGHDFFDYEPEHYDMIVSNPPYSITTEIYKRLFELEKPWAMLVHINGLFDSKNQIQHVQYS